MREIDFTKKMLSKLRESRDKRLEEAEKAFTSAPIEHDNFLTKSKILMEEAVKKNNLNEEAYVTIDKNTPQFGDVRVSQEEQLKKTIGENITLESDALKFYPAINGDPKRQDLTLTGKINALNLAFQFRYQDSSSDGCYIWCNALQLSPENTRTVGKIRDAFENWRSSIVEDGDLIAKLLKCTTKE